VGGVLEGLCWSGALLSVIGMLAVMPWVGSDKAIPGSAWLGLSLGAIVVFSGLGFAVRHLRSLDDGGRTVKGRAVRRGR